MDEKELKLKAMEITQDIVKLAIEKGHYTKDGVLLNGTKRAEDYTKGIANLIREVYKAVYDSLKQGEPQ
jgi:hypothetical protein